MPLPRLFILGDSVSIQYGPFLAAMVAGSFRYARKSGREAAAKNLDTPEPENGGDSRCCLAYLSAALKNGELQTDVLLLNCGLHDIKVRSADPDRATQVPIDEYRANLAKIISLVTGAGICLIWVRTTPVEESQHNPPGSGMHRHSANVDRFNAAADEVMAKHGVPAIDLHGFSLGMGPLKETLSDGRHFHEPIQRLQAAHIAGWLRGYRPSAR
ncbi:MAG: hypothetical protein K8S99_08725 [Planctomycetes bacterium]|nr:hypothetical protein [Planctomycetota bacterium]